MEPEVTRAGVPEDTWNLNWKSRKVIQIWKSRKVEKLKSRKVEKVEK
jgi:hypothetical protein